MPQAGWCRECGEWVWVDEEGGCQYGHGPECLEQIHEQEDPALAERPFGVGLLPTVLNRFSWGAFLLPLFWGTAYGVWQIIIIWGLVLSTPLLLGLAMGTATGQAASLSTVVSVSVISELMRGAAVLWAGLNAHRLLWNREVVRLERVPDAEPRFTVERFLARQRRWTLWGAIILGVGSLVTVPIASVSWKDYGLTYIGAAMPLLWLAAEVLLAFWLDVRMRAEPSDTEQPAGGVL